MSGRMNSDPDAAEERNSPAPPHASPTSGGSTMPQQDIDPTSLLLQVLGDFRLEMRGHVKDLREMVGDVSKQADVIEVRQESHRIELVEIKRRLDVANGRTAKAEDRLDRIEARHDRDDGEEDGRKAERDRMYTVARLASKPVTWAVGGVIGAVGYIVKDRAG